MDSYINKFLKISNRFFRQTKGQKKLFLFLGIINMTITNSFLQLFLNFHFVSTSLATLGSQLINMFLGYLIYSTIVFKRKKIFVKKIIVRYLLLMLFIWITNFYFIYLLEFVGFKRNVGAIILIPLLAFFSFIIQKYFVFKTN